MLSSEGDFQKKILKYFFLQKYVPKTSFLLSCLIVIREEKRYYPKILNFKSKLQICVANISIQIEIISKLVSLHK